MRVMCGTTETRPLTSPARPVRVMIVEDSHVIRELLVQAIDRDPRLEIVAMVESGEKALRVIGEVRPDVISMDIRLPGIDGMETTRRIMAVCPTPIVVVAANVEAAELKISINALRAGALSVLEKPAGIAGNGFTSFAQRLCTQLVIMSQVHVITQREPVRPITGAPKVLPPPLPLGLGKFEMIGMVASTGGPNALVQVLGSIGAEFPLPILLVQHITSAFSQAFVEWLGDVCDLRVLGAKDGDRPKGGTVYVAPADRHMVVRGKRIRIEDGAPLCGQCPSGTTLLNSMAAELGPAAVGVLLTGMGEDGAKGLYAVRAAGGHTVAEHESTAVVYGMPGAAIAMGAACEALPLPLIGPRLRSLVHRECKGNRP